jgi:hypothetical protein
VIEPAPSGAVAVQVLPAEVVVAPGEEVAFRIRAVNARGREVAAPEGGWSLEGLAGIVEAGRFRPDPDRRFRAGTVHFKSGPLAARSRVRVVEGLPWFEDFESYATDQSPPHWIGAGGKFKVVEFEGGKVLLQPPREQGLQRSNAFLGRSDLANYTVQVDVCGSQVGRRRPDIGVMAAGYTLELQGTVQRLQMRSWAAELKRMGGEVPFAWEMDAWYTMKLRVEVAGGKAVVRGKVWKTGTPEPEGWTLTAEDPYPVQGGSPGLTGYAPAPIRYDNLRVWSNE